MITADCELWLDGQRVPDRGSDLAAGETTALSGLVMQWGREDSVSQPDAATCRFQLYVPVGVKSPLDTVHVGMPVDVYSSGETATAGVDYYPDDIASFPLGPLAPDRYGQDGTYAPTVTDIGGANATQVAQNYCTAPQANNAWNPGYGTGGAGTTTDVADARFKSGFARQMTWTTGAPSGGWLYAPGPTVVAGEVWTFSMRAEIGAGVTGSIKIQLNPAHTRTAEGIIDNGDGTRTYWLTATFTGAGTATMILGYLGGAVGATLRGGDALTTKTASRTQFFMPAIAANVAGVAQIVSATTPGPNYGSAWAGTANASSSTLSTVPIAPTRVVRLAGVSDGSLWLTPAPYGVTPDAWDALPQISPGRTWQATITARVPVGSTAQLIARSYTAPNAAGLEPAGTVIVTAPPITGATGRVTVSGTLTLDADRPSPVWVALGLSVRLPGGPVWSDAAGTWQEHPEPWNMYATADLYDVQAVTQGASVRRVLVFAGSVTDATAAPGDELETLSVDVTAADITADLASDVIGGEPWPLEPLADRVAHIQQLSRLGIPTTVDASLAATPVSWRDVDAQPVIDLLRDLAQTAGGVLWPSSHATTGGYLWIENPDDRAALLTLAMVDGVVTVIGGSGRDVDIISACDVLREPVQLSQTITEITTTVTVGWKDQTLGDDGNPAPTDVSVTVTDDTGLATYGLRRMQISTELATATDATALANRTLAKSRAVTWRASGYTLNTAYMTDDVSVSDAKRMETLMDLLDGTTRIGQAVALVDLPGFLPDDAARVYVEGGTYTYADGFWELELTITPAGLSGTGGVTWADLAADWQWQEWDTGLEWIDLQGVAYTGGAH